MHSNSTLDKKSRKSGFSLVELLVTITMMAILTAMALPSFSNALRGNRVGAQNNDFLSALNYARNEAVSRSRGVAICAADTEEGVPGACSGAADWSKGWMVYLDGTTSDSPPSSIPLDTVLKTWNGNDKNELTVADDISFLRFDSRGQIQKNSTVVFTLKPVSDCSQEQQRAIEVNPMGRAKSRKMTCS